MDTIYKQKNRWLMAVLLFLIPFGTLFPYLAPAVIMPEMMQSLNIGYSEAGITITIMLACSGICMFVGSTIISKLGVRRTFVLSVWLLLAGNVVVYFANSFAVLMLGRVLAGVGYGITMSANMPYLSMWFDGKERTAIITANLVLNSLSQVAAFSLSRPLMGALGGNWKSIFLVSAIYLVVTAIMWTLLSKENPAMVQAQATQQTQEKPRQNPILCAMKIKQFWFIMAFAICCTFANSGFTTFLPTFLTAGKGLNDVQASTVSSIMSIAGIAGTLLGGVIAAKFIKRKTVIVVFSLVYIIGFFSVTLFSSVLALSLFAALGSVGYYAYQPAQSNMIIETPEPFDPMVLSGGFSLVMGPALISTMGVSPLFNVIQASLGMTNTFRVFSLIGIVGIVVLALLTKDKQR